MQKYEAKTELREAKGQQSVNLDGENINVNIITI